MWNVAFTKTAGPSETACVVVPCCGFFCTAGWEAECDITDMLPGWTVIFEAIILPNVTADDDWLAWVKHYPVVLAAVSVMTQVYPQLMKQEPEYISDHFGNENDCLVTFSTPLGPHYLVVISPNYIYQTNKKGWGSSSGGGGALITLEPWWDQHVWWSDFAIDNPTVLCLITSNTSHLIMRLSCHPTSLTFKTHSPITLGDDVIERVNQIRRKIR